MAAKNKIKSTNASPTVATTQDGTISLTLTIPWSEVAKVRENTLKTLQKDMVAPGFRKGNVPLNIVEEKTPENKLREYILNELLPKAFGDAISHNNIRPAMYPRFQIDKAESDKDWVIVAKTAQMPQVNLGDYRKAIKDAVPSAIWTPKDKKEQKEPSKDEKIAKALEILLATTDMTIAQILVDDEVDAKLSKLLERLEKLGITLESYLATNNKKVEDLRKDYEEQARRAIAIDLLLNKIANEEKIVASETEINKTFEDAGGTNMTDDQKRVTESVIRRQKVVELLATLL